MKPVVDRPAYTVRWAGAMRKVMRDRGLRATFDTATLKSTPHLWALGPAEGLEAEITLLDSVPHTAVVRKDQKVAVERTFPKAAFLVWAQVEEWQASPVPTRVRTTAHLEEFVAAAAKKSGLDLNRPFPFRVKGQVAKVEYHVVRAGLHVPFTLQRAPVHVLGFYSDRHHGIFTHQGTNIHLHFASPGPPASGHVDTLLLAPGATLYLPR